MSKCDACNKPVFARATYGTYHAYQAGRSHRVLNLCSLHLDELWSKCKGSVTAGVMHFVLEDPYRKAPPVRMRIISRLWFEIRWHLWHYWSWFTGWVLSISRK